MTKTDPLRTFYKTLIGKGGLPLEPDDPYCVPILKATPESDPILALWRRIDLAESESVNLLTGFRGNGKSTELLRLKHMLEKDGCQVFLVDMLDYVLMTRPLALSDFILSLMAALSEATEKSSVGEISPLSRSYWDRVHHFFSSEVTLEKIDLEVKAPGGAAKLGLKLKTDPDFKENIQKHLEGHLTRLTEDARQFIDAIVTSIREHLKDPDKKIVLLVDSLEQIRGVGEEAENVYASIVELFSGQAANLRFPKIHVVYTVPPYLPALAANLGRSLGGHPITQWPNIHVRNRENEPDPAGLAIMEAIVRKRFEDWETIVSRPFLRELASSSGGDLRDFFRLIRETIIGLSTKRSAKPDAILDETIVHRVVQQLRNELLPIARDDARWMARIHATKETALETEKNLPDLARFLDSNRIMNYLNGEPWYDVHPLLIDQIKRLAAEP